MRFAAASIISRFIVTSVSIILFGISWLKPLYVDAHPSLIECVCNTTTASSAVVSTTSSSTSSKYAIPSCIDDVFAETGIRYYIDGPILGNISYWAQEPIAFSTGRAAKRLISLGYRCSRTQLYDPTEDDIS